MTSPRKRNRASAKAAGARFERQVADFLAEVYDDRIDRRVKTGAKDKGDIAGLRLPDGRRVVVECKSTSTPALPAWWREVEQEKVNDDAPVGVIVHKRHGSADPAKQWVTMPLLEFVEIIADFPLTYDASADVAASAPADHNN